jgi:phage gp36-like protein
LSAYVTYEQVFGKISQPDVAAALDDNDGADGFQPGTLNTTRLDQIISDAGTEVEMFLSATYSTPFSQPYPQIAVLATLYFVCSSIYRRRNSPPAAEPYVGVAESYRETLKTYRNEPQSVSVNTPRAFAPGAAILECNSWDMNSA